MKKLINYRDKAENIKSNYFFMQDMFNNFYKEALAVCGERPIKDTDGSLGISISTLFMPKGKKGLESLRVETLKYDAARFKDGDIEFHVVKGGDFFDNDSWVPKQKLDLFGNVSYTLLMYVDFPMPYSVVEVIKSE